MALPDQQINTGSFVSTTSVLDVQQLYATDVTSSEFKELLVRLFQNFNNLSLSMNTREAGFYFLEEFVTGQLWHNPLSADPNNQIQGFRKVLFTSSDPSLGEADILPAGTTPIPHGLSPAISTSSTYTGWKFTRILGVASNTISRLYYPLNFSGPTSISAFADATNVTIVNNSTFTFDKVQVVLEYLKF